MSEPVKPKFIFMRINAAGYANAPLSLLCTFDPNSDMLLVAKAEAYETTRRTEFLHVTTQERDAVHDLVFSPDDSREAIAAFFGMDALKLVNYAGDMRRFDPNSVIERDGMDERGVKYRFRDTIENGQYAVLIAAFVAQKQRHVGIMGDFLAEFGEPEPDDSQVFTTY